MLRVVQWTTGNVGQRAALAVIKHPGLELVGCYAFSPAKTGRDVGELIGTDTVGIDASNRVDALLALKPDWQVDHAYTVEVKGQPCVNTRVQFYPGDDFVGSSFKDFMVIGMIATAMPAVKAIPAVAAARPGVVGMALPLAMTSMSRYLPTCQCAQMIISHLSISLSQTDKLEQ